MCELLVKAVDANHPDPKINLAGCYKRGDVVVIREDGFAWGGGELDAEVFSIVSMPGVTADAMHHLLNTQDQPIPNTAAMKVPVLRRIASAKARPIITRKRYSVDAVSQTITDKARP